MLIVIIAIILIVIKAIIICALAQRPEQLGRLARRVPGPEIVSVISMIGVVIIIIVIISYPTIAAACHRRLGDA